MATVRGLCSSSIVASTSQGASSSHSTSSSTSQLSSSSSRRNVLLSAEVAPRSVRKCRVVFAVLIDPKVKPASSPKSKTGIVDSRLIELVESADFQVRIQDEAQVTTSASKVSKTQKPVLGLKDTDLKSNLKHRLWVLFGGTVITGMVAKALLASQSSEDYLQVIIGAIAAYVVADLGTGIYHWGIDNYGDATTPVFGAQIDAFQGHHQRPWTITKREFANNIHAIARPAGIFLTPFLLLPSQPFVGSFLGLFLGLVVMSQQIHALSHMKKSQLPAYIVALQDSGVLLGRKMHGTHHRPPYDINYCIVSGLWNPLLNQTEIFKKAERYIYAKWNVAPRAWSETSEEWMQADSYFEDGSEFDPSQSS